MFQRFAFVLCVCFLAAAQITFPGREWQRLTPAAAGFDPARLQAAMNYGGWFLSGSYCVSVHRNGYLVADAYLQGFRPNERAHTWSTGKAVMSTLIGIAERNGVLNTNQRASVYIREWVGTAAADITIDHLLRHDSGRYYELINDFVIPQFLPDQTAFGISLSQAVPPGTRNQYNQMAFQALQRIFTVATGQTVQAASERELFTPLNMRDSPYWMNRSVILNVNQVHPMVYAGLHISCTDLARIGHLWLNNGVWNGQRILTPEFVQKALTPQQRPYGMSRRYHWGGPPNQQANGLGNQFVSFNLGNGVVMTRMGDPLSPGFQVGDFMNQVTQALIRDEKDTPFVPQVVENEPEEERAIAIMRRLQPLLSQNVSQAEIIARAYQIRDELGFTV